MKIKLLAFALVILGLSCKSNQSTETEVQQSTPKDSTQTTAKQDKITIDTLNNAIAQFLAGKNFNHEYFDSSLLKTWQNYRNEANKEWTLVENKILNGLDSFVKSTLLPKVSDSVPLFYPFSGPDYMFAEHFFPKQKRYIMAGLEPVGTVPELFNTEPGSLHNYLMSLKKALFFPNRLGFYRTRSMEKDFNDKRLNGTIHHLFYYIAKQGYLVTDVQPIHIDNQGLAHDTTFHKDLYAIRINIADADLKNEKEIIYFALDISDEPLTGKNQFFVDFVKKEQDFYTLMKSASYLLHKSHFSIMRKLVLDKSLLIVQDDTGVPYKYVNNENWDVDLYGYYTKTIPLFTYKFQPDLKKAMQEQSKGSLPFHIGYNLAHNEYNLMIIEKKQ